MVIRFEKRRRNGIVPLFDRLQSKGMTRRLTDRQIEHRKRMLHHLASVQRVAQ